MRTQPIGIQAARPHVVRAVLATIVAVTAVIVADLWGQLHDEAHPGGLDPATTSERAVTFACAAVVVLAGIFAVRAAAGAIRAGADARGAGPRGASLALLASVAGYLAVGLTTLGVLGMNVEGLLLGGAVTGVVVGIAAQQTIGNLFAGIVILVVRPFNVGEHVVLRSGPLGGEYEGVVDDMTLFYVHMTTPNGPVALPNAGVLASAVGPGARAAIDEPKVEMDEGE